MRAVHNKKISKKRDFYEKKIFASLLELTSKLCAFNQLKFISTIFLYKLSITFFLELTSIASLLIFR